MTIIAIIAGLAMLVSLVVGVRQQRALFVALAALFGLIGIAALGFLPGGWLAPVILAAFIVLGILIASAKFMVATAALSVLAFFALTVTGFFTGFGDSPAYASDAETESTASATPSPEGTATCDARFVQVAVDRSSTTQMEPRYDEKVRPIINDPNLTPEQKIDAINDAELMLAGSNAQTLASWANSAGLHDNPNDWQSLVEGGTIVDGGCLNEAGRMLYAKYEGAITAEGVTTEIGEAPENGTNTGINGDTSVVAGESGIRGDRTAVVRTLKDGSKLIKMVRCGNIVWITVPPNVPPGTTDNPPPPEPPKPPEVEVCPYNPALPKGHPDCLKPKSSNPNDYRRPGDGGKGQDVGTGTKPKAPDQGTAPESAPAPVVVQQPGGGGVVDTPTAPRGSESGGVAPGADPAPAQPAPVPSQESGGNGDNDGEVGGF